ncbi:hypothetical protein GS399_16935 [Pedobacter sp. HMF7647]|uniref:Uncharacterized protein n=1 Tax=Hufsiella arboris TaxID=2695275 RepID=A0A7K1YDK6_9SPHI|nr:hypothetical protein [Hufsiella arboris]MXV52662.1 hypothetical protein [Hufsiella arboris]
MKSDILFKVAAGVVLLGIGCKSENMDDLGKPKTLGTSSQYTVTTIAGGNNTEEQKDGIGKNAYFIGPNGIAVSAVSNNIYITDPIASSLRKIESDSIVTTIHYPENSLPALFAPGEIAVTNDGTITFSQNGDFRSSPSIISFKPGSSDHPISRELVDQGGLSADPQLNLVWAIDRARIQDNFFVYQIEPLKRLPLSLILKIDDVSLTIRFELIAACKDGVKYLMGRTYGPVNPVDEPQLYILDKNKVIKPATISYHFTDVTGITAKRDGSAIYVADNEFIKKIDLKKNTVEVIAGPNETYSDDRDGVGRDADVHAFKLAISKDESAIYFTEFYRSTKIRKITL